jgi:hypothetical protein
MALGGTVGLDLQSSPKNDNGVSSGANNIYISPGFGILLRKNLEIGIAAGYSHYTDKSEYGTGSASGMSKRDMNGYGASAYLRKYWMVSEKFFFYCIGSSGYGYSEDKLKVTNSNSEDYTQESKDNSIGVRVAPGFMFFPSAHWAFNAYIGSISYTFTKNKTDDVKTNHFTLGYGQIGFGLYYFIRKSENK